MMDFAHYQPTHKGTTYTERRSAYCRSSLTTMKLALPLMVSLQPIFAPADRKRPLQAVIVKPKATSRDFVRKTRVAPLLHCLAAAVLGLLPSVSVMAQPVINNVNVFAEHGQVINLLEEGVITGTQPMVIIAARNATLPTPIIIEIIEDLCLEILFAEPGSDTIETIDITVRNLEGEASGSFTIEETVIDLPTTPNCDSAGQPPSADAGGPYSVETPAGAPEASIQLDASASTDDNGISSWEWVVTNPASGQVVTTASGEMPSPIMLPEGTFIAELTVSDRDGELLNVQGQPVDTQKTDVATAQITVGAGSVNEAPVSNAGPDQTLTDDDADGVEFVQLDGSQATDDTAIVSYSWSESGQEIATGVRPAPFSLTVGTHIIVLRATDEEGLFDDDQVMITIGAPSSGPVISNAGPDQTLTDEDGNGNESVQLDGSASTSDVPIATYSWLEEGEEIATGAQPTVSLPVGTHVIVLRVVDEEGRFGEDTVVITINAPEIRDLASLPGLNAGQRSLATAIDSLCPRLAELGAGQSLTEGEQDLLNRCNALISTATTEVEAVAALRAIHGEEIASQQTNAMDYSKVQLSNVGARIVALRGGSGGGINIAGLNVGHDGQVIPLAQLGGLIGELLNGGGAAGDEDDESGGLLDNRLGIFVNGSIRIGDKDETANEAGFDFDSWGITAGLDYRFTDRFVLGLALGYSGSDTEFAGDGGGIDGDSFSGSVYGTYFNDRLYFDFIGSTASVDYDSARHIVYTDASGLQDLTAVGQTDGDLTSFGLSFGYDFHKGGWTFGPTLAVNRIEVEVDPFAETGAGGLNLAFAAQEAKSQTLQGGFRFSYASSRSWGVLSPHARVALVKEMENDSEILIVNFVSDPFVNDPTQPSPGIVIITDEPDDSYVRWGMGLSAVFVNGVSAFVDYDTFAGFSDISSHELSFGIRLERSFR